MKLAYVSCFSVFHVLNKLTNVHRGSRPTDLWKAGSVDLQESRYELKNGAALIGLYELEEKAYFYNNPAGREGEFGISIREFLITCGQWLFFIK